MTDLTGQPPTRRCRDSARGCDGTGHLDLDHARRLFAADYRNESLAHPSPQLRGSGPGTAELDAVFGRDLRAHGSDRAARDGG